MVQNAFQSWTGGARIPPWAASRSDSATSLAAFIGIPLALGMIAGFVTQGEILTWYRRLKKPSWQPPAFLFGPIWMSIYALMGVSSWMVWTHGGFEKQKVPLTLYGINLLLNLAWQPLFFLFHDMEAALVDALGIVASLVMTMFSFHKVEPLAALLLVPYLLWGIFATALTSAYMNLNPQETRAGATIEKTVVMEPAGGVGEVKTEVVAVKKEE